MMKILRIAVSVLFVLTFAVFSYFYINVKIHTDNTIPVISVDGEMLEVGFKVTDEELTKRIRISRIRLSLRVFQSLPKRALARSLMPSATATIMWQRQRGKSDIKIIPRRSFIWMMISAIRFMKALIFQMLSEREIASTATFREI